MYGALVGALALSVALRSVVPYITIMVWLAIFTAIQIPRYLLVSSYKKTVLSDKAAVSWGRKFAFWSALTGLTWGLAGVFLFPEDSFVHQCLLAVFLAGVAASSGVGHAPLKESFVPVIVLSMVPMCARFFYEGTEIHVTIGAIGLLYTATIVGITWSVHNLVCDSIGLRMEKDDLIESLETAREDLEIRVAERTADLIEKNEQLEKEVLDRKRTEEALKISEERVRAIVEHSTSLFYSHDTGHVLTYVSPQTRNILDCEPEEALVNWTHFVTANAVNREGFELTQKAIETGVRQPPYQLELITKKGRTVWVEINESPIVKNGRTVAIAGSVTDISERRETENALRDSEERYRLLAQNSLTGIYIIQDDEFVYVNDRLAEILHYSPEEILGRKYWEFVHPQEVSWVVRNAVSRTRGGEAPSQYEFQVLCKNGETKSLEAFVAPIHYRGRSAVMGNVADVTKRKLTEQLLRASEERYRTLFENAADAIFILDGEAENRGRILSANRSAARMHGYAMSELMDLTVDDLQAQEEMDGLANRMGRILRGEWVKEEILHKRKDGSLFPVEVSAGMLQLPHQKCILAIDRDITDRKLAEQTLRKHKETLEALLNATTDVAVLLDATGNVLALNRQLAATLGKDPNHLVGKSIFHHGPAHFVAQRMNKFSAIVKGGKPVRDVEVGTDGRIYDTSASPVFDTDGKVEGVALFSRDITEARRAEEELRRSESKYRKILETIADGYHEVSLRGYFTLVNDSTCEILGYGRDELPGVYYKQIVDEAHVNRVFLAYNEVYRTGISNPEFTYRINRKNGEKRDVSASITLIRDEGGEPCGFRGTLRDVTERRQLEEQLRQAVKMEAIGRMAGGVAHDFNNLLTAIMGYSDILSSRLPQEGPLFEKLQQINRASERAAELTRQLLAFSRKQVLDVRVVNLNLLVCELEDMFKRMIGEDVELDTIFEPKLGNVRADPTQVAQIIMNLVVNARDAMPKGGKLTIETINTILDESYARTRSEVKPGLYVMLSVSDTGIGMDLETRSRAFDPFFTTKEKGLGTGLGLSTVYGIVKQHGGHIAVYSELGRGTTFKIYLPLIDEAAQPDAVVVDNRERPLGTETILLVEDEETVRDLACEALEMLGYQVLGSASPEEAITISENHAGQIHLLLTDVVLPRMDGRSLYLELSPKRPGMKVLYVSGYTENFIVHHGVLDEGVNFLQKPFSLDGLSRRVRDLLDQ